MTATGLRGADTEGAASHVEEVLNTEPGRATIRHQQTAELAVEDRANKQEGVIHILAKVSSSWKTEWRSTSLGGKKKNQKGESINGIYAMKPLKPTLKAFTLVIGFIFTTIFSLLMPSRVLYIEVAIVSE